MPLTGAISVFRDTITINQNVTNLTIKTSDRDRFLSDVTFLAGKYNVNEFRKSLNAQGIKTLYMNDAEIRKIMKLFKQDDITVNYQTQLYLRLESVENITDENSNQRGFTKIVLLLERNLRKAMSIKVSMYIPTSGITKITYNELYRLLLNQYILSNESPDKAYINPLVKYNHYVPYEYFLQLHKDMQNTNKSLNRIMEKEAPSGKTTEIKYTEVKEILERMVNA